LILKLITPITDFTIIVSLAYLSIQIKSGAHDFRATTRDSAFRSLEDWNHLLDGTVGQEDWDTNCQILYAYALQSGAQHYWNLRKGVFDPRFCEIIESNQSSNVPAGHVVSGLGSDIA
jgi:hypothetical protein